MARSQFNWTQWVFDAIGRQSYRRRPKVCSDLSSLERLEERALLSATSKMNSGRWTINADIDATLVAETIVVEQSPSNPNRLRVVINGEVIDERAARRVKTITVNAGSGNDTVSVQLPAALSRIVVSLNGGTGDDTLNAGTNRGILNGGDGNDVLNGSAYDDQLFGGRGADILTGNGGNDVLHGDDDNDTLVGGMGSDTMQGGSGADWIYSSLGVDAITSDENDIVTAEEAVGIQQFASEAEFVEWLSHTDYVNQKLGFGSLLNASAGPFMDVVRDGAAPTSAAADHSDTNTQVAGVDEQDIIETDGDYIYTIRGSELIIIDVRDPAQSEIISRTDLGGWGAEMYLDGDHLTVIASINRFWTLEPVAFPDVPELTSDAASLRFAAPWWNWRPQTQVTTFDLSDRTQPKVVEDTVLDGSVTTSRAVDGRIYLVVNNSLWLRPPYLFDVATNTIDVATPQVRLSSTPSAPILTDWSKSMPEYTTRSYDAAGNVTVRTGSLLDSPNIWSTEDPLQNANLMTIAMFDIHHGQTGLDSTSTVFGLTGEIYASDEALYVASQDWNFPVIASSVAVGPTTSLYKFDLTEEGSKLVATGRVDGTIINQFAMDEHAGYFRIATTSNPWQADRSSNVFILEQQGDDLVTVSSLTGLSPTESIQSARFIGDHVYLSTFLRIDPLLNINLSDPLNPFVQGELEVPGFSSYLQQWGDDYLVSIGQDADPATGMVTGLQLSLFNISGDQPTLVDTFKISVTAWDSYSQAQWNHHAFSLFEEDGILAIPVSRWNSNADYSTELQVFQLDGVNGFSLLGSIDHDSEVLRSLRIGDELFSLSYDALKVNALTNPATEVADVPLVNPLPIPDPFPYPNEIDLPLEPVFRVM